MTTETTALAAPPDDTRRRVALLKAVGLDKLAPEQRELALNLSERYGLDLLLKHLVLIEGRAYITRDGLLHIAHRSGVLDGIEVTEPRLDGDFWRASCSVYRRDMTRPFTYGGRYPAKGGNARFAPEMAIKVAEVMALRRAFDVSAPTAEERWDVDMPADDHAERPTLAQRVEAKRAEIVVEETETEQPSETVEGELVEAETAAEPGMTDEEARVAFKTATALVPRDVVTDTARRVFPGVAGSKYTIAHYRALVADLREQGYAVEL
jgi:hypothetical protein